MTVLLQYVNIYTSSLLLYALPKTVERPMSIRTNLGYESLESTEAILITHAIFSISVFRDHSHQVKIYSNKISKRNKQDCFIRISDCFIGVSQSFATRHRIPLSTLPMCTIKTHGSVSCGPRKRGTRKLREYINRNNKVAIFTHL